MALLSYLLSQLVTLVTYLDELFSVWMQYIYERNEYL